ncbi:MAG TPA: hypothetical protein DCE71_08610 [Parachlamydiales bacterium]|nr:hypothetical protein [Parachlamydiales bacterium]
MNRVDLPNSSSPCNCSDVIEELMKEEALPLSISDSPRSSGGMDACLIAMDSLRKNELLRTQHVERSPFVFFDPHSFSNPEQVRVTHMRIIADFDVSQEQMQGAVHLDVVNQTGTEWLYLDSKDLTILEVLDEPGNALEWFLGDKDPLLGQRLAIRIGDRTSIKVRYITSKDAEGLYWHSKDPENFLLYSHSQPTYTRSWLPCQDTPGVRTTLSFAFLADPRWLAVSSSGNNPEQKVKGGIYRMETKITIPSYLIAFCVGNLEYRKTGERTGIYAHPEMIDRAYDEFSHLELVLDRAEQLLGEYSWGRYDMLILPVDFPAGAVENPMVSFFSSAVVAGDKSLMYYLFHELAHAWAGNKVTARGWEHLWLNEGITTYIELILAEEFNGKDYAEMLEKIYYNKLVDELAGSAGFDGALRMHLEGRNPRDAFSLVPYYKGYFFLKMLEKKIGKEKLLPFLKKYFEAFRFQSVTTEEFESYLFTRFPEVKDEDFQVYQWLYEPGLPGNCPMVQSEKMTQIEQLSSDWLQRGDLRSLKEMVPSLTPQQWVFFIQNLKTSTASQLAEIDALFDLRNHPNLIIREAWLTAAVHSQYTDCYPAVKAFVLTASKPRIVRAFLSKLMNSPEGADLALEIYNEGKSFFYPRSLAAAEAALKIKHPA